MTTTAVDTTDALAAADAAADEADAEYLRPQFCSVVEQGCLNPAGFGVSGGGYAPNTRPSTRARCDSCGEPVCAACRTGKRGAWTCNSCTEREAYFSARSHEAAADEIKAAIRSA